MVAAVQPDSIHNQVSRNEGLLFALFCYYLLCRDPEHAVHCCSPSLENRIGRAATEHSSAHGADGSDRVHPKCILHVFVPLHCGCHYRSNLVVLGAVHGCYNTARVYWEG